MTRTMRSNLLACGLTLLAAAAPAYACSVCTAGDSDSPWVDAANKGVLVMIGFVAFVLTGVVSVAGMWYVRARRLRDPADTPANQ